MSNDAAGPDGSGLSEGLGLPPERAAFERFAQRCPMGCYSVQRKGDGYWSSHTQLMWDAWQAAWNCQQAEIDRLMLEHCPDEMTPAQMAAWGVAQVPAQAFVDAARENAHKA